MTEHIASLEEELVKANERTEAKQLELDAANEEFKQYQVGYYQLILSTDPILGTNAPTNSPTHPLIHH